MKYIASCSGGKDSIATIILAHKHKEPLDLIIFSEVMFDENISGELPEHIDFINNKAFPVFNEWGYETKILRSDKTYMDCFYHVVKKSEKNKGKRQGFPRPKMCKINDRCKTKPIDAFFSKINKDEYLKYVGIAIDEPERIARIKSSTVENRISLLEKYGYTEQMALELCKKYDLLSPIYEFAPRGGCWFCPNAKLPELRHLRKNHRELWNKLLELEEEPNLIGNMWNTLTKICIHDLDENFYWEEQQMNLFDMEGTCVKCGER